MNPNDNEPASSPFPSNDVGPSPVPAGPPSAGDDAALQAIEALEAESNELPPLTMADLNVSSPTTPIAAPTPAAQTTPITPEQIATGDTVTPMPEPAPIVPNTPVSPLAASLGESLKSEATSPTVAPASFDVFNKPKRSNKKLIIILVAILVVLGLAVGGYFVWNNVLNKPKTTTPASTSTTQTDSPAINEPNITDTETGVNSTVTDMETQLNSTNDDEFSDTTLSDSSLNN